MYEIRMVRQDDPELTYRWFTSENLPLDLYVWQSRTEGRIVQFQFCFESEATEHVVEWRAARLWMARVESDAPERRHKGSPVFRRSADLDLGEATALLERHGHGVDEPVRRFVLAELGRRRME